MADDNESVVEQPRSFDIADATQAITGILDRGDTTTEEPAVELENSEDTAEEFDEEGEIDAAPEDPDFDDEQDSELAGSDDEEPEEEVQVQPQKYTVKAAGETFEVTEEELIRGYQRQQDYTRSKQQVAEAAKQYEQQLAEIRNERERTAQTLDALQANLVEPQKPDQDLLELDPMEYVRQKEVYEQRLAQAETVQAERTRLVQQATAEQEQMLKQMLEVENQKIVEKVPSWGNAETRQDETRKMMDYAIKEFGYTGDELQQIYDSRLIHALHKLWKYEEATKPNSKARQKVKKAPKVVRSGARQPAKAEKKPVRDARRRLKKSGSVKDAAALLYQTLE